MRRKTTRGHQFIHIRETENTPLFRIRDMELTCSVNFITWNKAYSVFAYQTFILQEGYLFRHAADIVVPQILQIWKNVSINIAPVSLQDALASNSNTESQSSMLGKRLVGDKRSWIIPLNITGIEPSQYPDYPVDYAGFKVTTSMKNAPNIPTRLPFPPFNHYVIEMTVLKSLVLRHQYIFADEANAERIRFRDRAIVQLHALPVEQRPSGFARIFNQRHRPDISAGEDFAPPEEWTYFDDEMLKFLETRYPKLSEQLKR